MESHGGVGLGFHVINSAVPAHPDLFLLRISCFPNLRRLPRKRNGVSVCRSSALGSQAVDDVMQLFIEERQLNGDFISKFSDALWRKGGFISAEAEVNIDDCSEVLKVPNEDNNGGFLKITKMQEWVSGDSAPPINMKLVAKKCRNDSEMRKRLNLLKYNALKRELLLLTTGIGAACTGYCLVALSIQAAISYAAGVLFSCLYLQLLFRHSDDLSKDSIPQIFMLKKSKKIGIRSEDLKNLLEKTVKGSALALSSPRLVIPAAIYGLWAVSHHFFNESFDFQLVPAMFGMFAYKAAALVQVYRDNEDLGLVFPDNEEGSGN